MNKTTTRKLTPELDKAASVIYSYLGSTVRIHPCINTDVLLLGRRKFVSKQEVENARQAVMGAVNAWEYGPSPN